MKNAVAKASASAAVAAMAEALAMVSDRFLDAARKRPELSGVFTPFSARVPQLRFLLDRTKAQRMDVSVADVFSVLQAYLGGLYVNDFNLYGKVWKVYIQAEGKRRATPNDIGGLYVLNHKGSKVPLSSLGDVTYTLAPIDVPHYNLYNAANVSIPGAVSIFPGENYQAPWSWTELAYRRLIYYNKVDEGEHYAAWEQRMPNRSEAP